MTPERTRSRRVNCAMARLRIPRRPSTMTASRSDDTGRARPRPGAPASTMARVASAGVETQGLRDLVRGRVVTLRQCEQAAQCGGERGDDEGARVDRLGRHEARGRRTRAGSAGRLRRPAADAIAFGPPPQLLV